MPEITLHDIAGGRMPTDYTWRVMMMAGLGFWQIRLDGNDGPVIIVNDEFPLLLGRTREDFPTDLAEFLETCVHPDDHRDFLGLLQALTPEASRFEVEHRLFSAKDGDWRWFRVQGDVGEFGEDERPVELFGGLTDIHEARAGRLKFEKQAAALRDERDRVDAIIDAGGLMVWDWNLADDTARVYSSLYVSQGGEKQSIEGPAEVVWGSVLAPDEWRRVLEAKDRCARGEVPYYDIEYPVTLPDGRRVWWYDRGRLVRRGEDKRTLHLLGVTVDVTRQKETDFALEETLLRHRQWEESADVATWEWNLADDTIAVNDVYIRRFGYTAADFPARTMVEWHERLCAPEDRERVADIFDGMINPDGVDAGQCILRIRHRDGHFVWVHATARVLERDPQGRVIRMDGVQTDVSAMKQLEARQSEDAETIARQKDALERELAERNRLTAEIHADLEDMLGNVLPAEESGSDTDRAIRREMQRLREAMAHDANAMGPAAMREYVMMAIRLLREERVSRQALEVEHAGERRMWADMLSICPVALSISSRNVVLYASRRARETLDLRPGDHYHKIMEPDDLAAIRQAMDAAPDHQVEWTPVRLRLPSGERGDFLLNVVDTAYEGKTAAAAWVVDVTQLEKVDHRMRLMLDAIPLAVTFWDADCRPIDANAYAPEMFGVADKAEYLARFYELSPPTQPNGRASDALAKEYIQQALREGEKNFRWLHRGLDGTPIPCEVSLRAIALPDGKAVVGICRDVREIMARRAQTAQVRTRMRNLMDAVPFAAALFDAEDAMMEGNAAAAAMFGLEDAASLPDHFTALSPLRQPDGKASLPTMRSWLATARQEGEADFPWMHQRADGSPLPVRVRLRALSSQEDAEVAAFLTAEDGASNDADPSDAPSP